MFTPFVTDEHPVALYAGVPPQYTSEGLAIDCALVLHVLKGTARIRCNFEIIEEQADSVVLFNPDDIIKVEQRSPDFEVEILAFSSFIQLAALNQLENVNISALRRSMILDTPETASAASGMVRLLRPAIDACTVRELYFISVMQLRAFYMLYQVMLRRNQIEVDAFKSRGDELFFKFRQLLGEHYRESRSVAFYADKLCITTRYLTNIVQARYGKSPKEAIDTYTVMQIRLDLLQTDITLTELAYKYHFSSPSFFSDYFRRNAGCSPQEYRLQNNS
ncbi:MAG: AraC family transcriptional regulator [Prevotella sp.]|nr:AraC family transcriptional regulator [Prevotella sp.]